MTFQDLAWFDAEHTEQASGSMTREAVTMREHDLSGAPLAVTGHRE